MMIEDFLKTHRTMIPAACKGRLHNLNLLLTTDPEAALAECEKEFASMGGRVYQAWGAVRDLAQEKFVAKGAKAKKPRASKATMDRMKALKEENAELKAENAALTASLEEIEIFAEEATEESAQPDPATKQ